MNDDIAWGMVLGLFAALVLSFMLVGLYASAQRNSCEAVHGAGNCEFIKQHYREQH